MENFHKKLDDLQEEIVNMASFALKMLDDGVISLKDQDQHLADDVYERRLRLLEYDNMIEHKTLKILTLYQPMATDMRIIACILKSITYLYRIGRYGKDIAKITFELKDKPHFKKLVSIAAMAKIVIEMVNDSVKAFKEKDIGYIENLSDKDDEVDELNHSIFREVLSYMMEDSHKITQGAYYIMASRFLERCGDMACKFGEKIQYMVTGEYKEIK